MLSINITVLVVASIAFFLLGKLLAFHMYIKSKGMSTYDYILQQRAKHNKIGPGSLKDSALMRKPRLNAQADVLEGSEDSREGVNVIGNITQEISKEQLAEIQRLSDEDSRASHKQDKGDVPTDAKPKSGEAKNSTEPNSTSKIIGSNDQALRHPLKEDESSFILTKPAILNSSNYLASEFDCAKTILKPPVSSDDLVDQEPGDWTHRKQVTAEES